MLNPTKPLKTTLQFNVKHHHNPGQTQSIKQKHQTPPPQFFCLNHTKKLSLPPRKIKSLSLKFAKNGQLLRHLHWKFINHGN